MLIVLLIKRFDEQRISAPEAPIVQFDTVST